MLKRAAGLKRAATTIQATCNGKFTSDKQEGAVIRGSSRSAHLGIKASTGRPLSAAPPRAGSGACPATPQRSVAVGTDSAKRRRAGHSHAAWT